MIVLCLKCKATFDSQESKCPKCGSADRSIEVFDSTIMYESHTGVENELIYSGKRKFFYEEKVKPDFDRDTQQDVMVTRKYNRRRDCISLDGSYVEEIKTKDKKILKRKTGKLSEHQGHGDDRKNRQQKEAINGGDPDA